MVGRDDRWPGDDENVPTGLERGRQCPEHFTEPATDTIANHRPAEHSAGRQPEAGRLEIGPPEPGGQEWVGPGGPASLERREVLRAESITSRGVFEPRPMVRLSAAFDRERDVWPGLAGRRPTSSGRGSRAPWRGGASWADRSASSGLSGILSIRPRGRSVTTPEGTQTRLAPKSARRVVVRRMIGRAFEGVKRSRPSRLRRHAHILHGSITESPCEGRPAGAILSGPSTPETYAGVPESPDRDPRERVGRCLTAVSDAPDSGSRATASVV